MLKLCFVLVIEHNYLYYNDFCVTELCFIIQIFPVMRFREKDPNTASHFKHRISLDHGIWY